jgi:hypothetical protein
MQLIYEVQAKHVYSKTLQNRHNSCPRSKCQRSHQLTRKQLGWNRPSALCPSSSIVARCSLQATAGAAAEATAAAAAEAASPAMQQDGSCLQNLLLWLVNNGEPWQQRQQQQHHHCYSTTLVVQQQR